MATARFTDDRSVMLHAVELARRGLGAVEPNPMVGAVVVDEQFNVLGEGWHQQFGGPHAEVHALNSASDNAAGQTIFVTLEPCSHHGKTPPCVDAVLASSVRRVVIGSVDPADHASGRGVDRLREAGLRVDVGIAQAETDRLIAPFRKLMVERMPYVHAKWAMSLDGKIATRTGDSQWISNEQSRAVVHELRARMDAVVVGARTAELDDPLLNARLPDGRAPVRTATRVVVDSHARLSPTSKLATTARAAPVLLAALESTSLDKTRPLESWGVEVLRLSATPCGQVDVSELMRELGKRKMTNVFVEGGGELLGSIFDARLVDEFHVFVGPRVIGGRDAAAPVGGVGAEKLKTALKASEITCLQFGNDVYINGFST